MALTIKLKNTGAKPLRFSSGFGPWGGSEQIRLVAIKLPLGEPISNEMRVMRDPPLGYIELKPGESEEHSVLIDHLYPELAAELRKRKTDLVLFWTYQLITADSAKSERQGGWLILPAKAE